MESETPDRCRTRQQLEDLGQHHLRELAELALEEEKILKAGDEEQILALDKRIETKLGEKERVLGALQEHRREHGC